MAEALFWSLLTAAASWLFTLAWARAAVNRDRAESEDELRFWQAEALRARELASQLRQERDVWSRGCKQGRRDVMSIMPLLVAAQRSMTVSRLAEDATTEKG